LKGINFGDEIALSVAALDGRLRRKVKQRITVRTERRPQNVNLKKYNFFLLGDTFGHILGLFEDKNFGFGRQFGLFLKTPNEFCAVTLASYSQHLFIFET
jgi:hypothetical protein